MKSGILWILAWVLEVFIWNDILWKIMQVEWAPYLVWLKSYTIFNLGVEIFDDSFQLDTFHDFWSFWLKDALFLYFSLKILFFIFAMVPGSPTYNFSRIVMIFTNKSIQICSKIVDICIMLILQLFSACLKQDKILKHKSYPWIWLLDDKICPPYEQAMLLWS